MSDLFHEEIPDKYIWEIFNVMKKARRHRFQVLTKRSTRMADFLEEFEIPENVWVGVTVEDKKDGKPRIDKLSKVQASVRFLSMEPLLKDLDFLNMKGINWVIIGGETGSSRLSNNPFPLPRWEGIKGWLVSLIHYYRILEISSCI